MSTQDKSGITESDFLSATPNKTLKDIHNRKWDILGRTRTKGGIPTLKVQHPGSPPEELTFKDGQLVEASGEMAIIASFCGEEAVIV